MYFTSTTQLKGIVVFLREMKRHIFLITIITHHVQWNVPIYKIYVQGLSEQMHVFQDDSTPKVISV